VVYVSICFGRRKKIYDRQDCRAKEKIIAEVGAKEISRGKDLRIGIFSGDKSPV
jgi:hypothetical protein